MKRKVRKLALSRETLRQLDETRMWNANGAGSVACGTGETGCAPCYTTDVTDCPGCVFTNACVSLQCPSGLGGC